MAEITTANGQRHAGVRKSKKLSTRVDLTPMVDLGFLLITFFIVSNSLSKPRDLRLYLPAEGGPTDVANSATLTLIPFHGDQVFYYHGELQLALATHQYGTTNFSVLHGIGDIIRQKKQALAKSARFTAKDIIVVIKPHASANLKGVVSAIDEMLIDDVGRYAMTDLEKTEMEALTRLHVL
ncbi:MAG TPA: biopolymer transporter ExbD [Chitinophagaceae bacterium]|jgi:hypothetical protein